MSVSAQTPTEVKIEGWRWKVCINEEKKSIDEEKNSVDAEKNSVEWEKNNVDGKRTLPQMLARKVAPAQFDNTL